MEYIYKAENFQPQPDRVDVLVEKEMIKVNFRAIDQWDNKFDALLQKINETPANISSIDNSLKYFKLSIKENNYPSIDFLINRNVLSFFFVFLQSEWQNSLKYECFGIIELLVTNLKTELIDLITDQMITTFSNLLLNRDLTSDIQYPKYTYNITQILRKSCDWSSDFAVTLYKNNFQSGFVTPFLITYKDRIINTFDLIRTGGQINQPNFPYNDCVYCSFFNIIDIYGTWCKLKDSIPDEFIINLINDFTQMIQSNNLKMINKICKTLIQAFEGRETLISILSNNGFLEILWDFIENKIETRFALEILSYGLISEDEIQQKVANIVKINLILQKTNTYVESLHESNFKKLEKTLESLIVLIVNYINFFNEWPSNVKVEEILELTEKILITDANFHIKNCATFLALQLFKITDPLEIEKRFSKELIEIVFDVLSSTSDEIINKAIEVFEIILAKANKIEYDPNSSVILESLIPNFLNNITNDDQFSDAHEKTYDLLSRFYPNMLSAEFDQNQ